MTFWKYTCLYCGFSILTSRKAADPRCTKCQHGMIFMGKIVKSREEIYAMIEARR